MISNYLFRQWLKKVHRWIKINCPIEDIWKLGFNLEKCKVLHIGSKIIKVKYKL